jgi:hypothetical protein
MHRSVAQLKAASPEFIAAHHDKPTPWLLTAVELTFPGRLAMRARDDCRGPACNERSFESQPRWTIEKY